MYLLYYVMYLLLLHIHDADFSFSILIEPLAVCLICFDCIL